MRSITIYTKLLTSITAVLRFANPYLLLLVLLIPVAACDEPDDANLPTTGPVDTEEPIDETPPFSATELALFNWFDGQQLPNGLLASVEGEELISLYDNALAAMVFMLREDFERAERIFDFFKGRIETELTSGVGGFYQFRNPSGTPTGSRWMGDNAWLLIALNNYEDLTGSLEYDELAVEIADWLIDLQDTDGGLFAGYAADNSLMNYRFRKVISTASTPSKVTPISTATCSAFSKPTAGTKTTGT